MQGRWVEEKDPSFYLIVEGGEINLCGKIIDYRYKSLSADKGALMVDLEFAEEINPDDLDLTLLFYWPDDSMNTFSDHCVARLVRANS